MRYGKTLVFSLVFILIYVVAFMVFDHSGEKPGYNLALFIYYPRIAEFHFTAQGSDAGPAMSWYGWMATSALAAGAVALAVPSRLADRIAPAVSWVVPAILVVAVLVYETERWFI